MKFTIKRTAAMAVLGTLLSGASVIASAATPADILKQQCIACHAVSKPATTSVDRLWERKGPDLHYAGAKFNRAWLEKWLQAPVAIRPAGVMYAKAVKAGEGKTVDVIDAKALTEHPKLSKEDAAAVAEELMKLGVADGLVEKGGFKNEPVNASMANLLFNKLRGCASCHSGKPGSGGQSGPELYTAGDRLQADYMVAYIKNPQKFDPHVWMPSLGLNEGDVQKLTGYLTTLKSAGAQ